MLKRLFLGLLALPLVCPSVLAGDASGDIGPAPPLSFPALQRLPTVEESLPVETPLAESPPIDLPTEEPVEESPELVVPVKLWEGEFELGLDGSEGNSPTFNYQLGFDAKRTVPDRVFTVSLDYVRKTTRSEETTHRALLETRHEWLLLDSPWSLFIHGTADYDEFKEYDVRVAADVGLGYQLIETERTSLASRAGGGFSHEIGGTDDAYVPEAVFGLEFKHQLSERQKLTAMAEYAPDVTDFNDFRLNTRAGWEIVVDEQMNLSLRFSVLDRYDSTPHGAKPNDFEYAATLLWKF